MKYFFVLVIFPFLFFACTQNNEVDFFAKKEKCKEYLIVMIEKVEIEKNFANHPTEPTIFYSPSLDTCIGTYTTMLNGDTTFYMYDVLTNENIYFEQSARDEAVNGWNDFKAKIEELKK